MPVGRRQSPEQELRLALRRDLEARGAEIEREILTRIYGIADPSKVPDSEYLQGLHRAVSAACEYGVTAVSGGEDAMSPIPAALLEQARAAARSGVALGTVLRRYAAGYALLNDFIVEEAERRGLVEGGVLKRVLRDQTVLLDRLLVTGEEEYQAEVAVRFRSSNRRRSERIERLLAGEFVDTSGLAYEFDAYHVGLVATGSEAAKAVDALAGMLDRRALSVSRGEDTVWAWLGGRRPVDRDRLVELATKACRARLSSLALGEPGPGLHGWRLTHRQAIAAHPIAIRTGGDPVRYADVALLASAIQDDVLATSLYGLYLAPLEAERDGGEISRQTLRAYFSAARNISSTAAALRLNRNTVMSRLRAIEGRIGRLLESCTGDLEAALRLEEFGWLPTRAQTRHSAEPAERD